MNPSEFRLILARFGLDEVPLEVVEGGHINRSWRAGPFLLQRINPQVFPNGQLVVSNVAAVCQHLRQAAIGLGLSDLPRRIVQIRLTTDGAAGIQARDGAWWRVLHLIEGTRVFQRADTPQLAREAGSAFGLFQRLLADYQQPALAETIPGFHDTGKRLQALEVAIAKDVAGRATEIGDLITAIRQRKRYAEVLPPLLASGELPTRVVHNDAKIGNVLFDQSADQALAVIDLDTVMPGTLLSDTGDLIRSMASPTDEDEPDASKIAVSQPVVLSLIQGLLQGSGGIMSTAERELLIFSGILLAYEQGTRFLTDHLDGDRYYKIARPQQNLDRARAQLTLVLRLEAARPALEQAVARL